MKEGATPCADARIIVLEDSDLHCRLFERWLSPLTVCCVQSLDELRDQYHSAVTVVCLCESMLGDEASEIRKELLNRNPHCQLVLVQPRSGFTSIHEDTYDACLQRPLFEEELQSTVEHRLKCGLYSTFLGQFYALNAKLGIFATDDVPDDVEITKDADELRELRQRAQTRLQRLQQELDGNDITSITRSLDRHKQILTSPDHDEAGPGSAKYHPQRCPSCRLSWGTDHGNELQCGFVRIAADVWKCKRCGEVVQGLGESHRRIN